MSFVYSLYFLYISYDSFLSYGNTEECGATPFLPFPMAKQCPGYPTAHFN